MSEATFDIAFYGIIQPGKDKDVVMQNMAALFKTTPDKIRPYFAGGRKVIKSGVNQLTAEKYRSALENVGLVIKLEACADETETGAQAPAVATSVEGISMAEVGADVLPNPPAVEAQPIGDISNIGMAEVGADVLPSPAVVEAQPIGDISDISLAEVGADVLPNPAAVEAQPISDISDISLAEVGADIIENPQPKPAAPLPDTSELSVIDDN